MIQKSRKMIEAMSKEERKEYERKWKYCRRKRGLIKTGQMKKIRNILKNRPTGKSRIGLEALKRRNVRRGTKMIDANHKDYA